MARLSSDRPGGNARRQTSPGGDIQCELGSEVVIDHRDPSDSRALDAAQRKISRLD